MTFNILLLSRCVKQREALTAHYSLGGAQTATAAAAASGAGANAVAGNGERYL